MEVSLSHKYSEGSSLGGLSICNQDPSACVEDSDLYTVVSGSHMLAHKSTGMSVALEDAGSLKMSPHLRAGGT